MGRRRLAGPGRAAVSRPLREAAAATDDRGETLGGRIRRRRWEERRVRQRDLAAAAGVSPGYLSEIEHDAARATAPTLRRLALALGLDGDAFVAQAAAAGGATPSR